MPCLCFRRIFFISKGLHHGTRNLFGQTVNNVVLKQTIYFDNDDCYEQNEKAYIVEPEIVTLAEISDFSQAYFSSLGFNKETKIESSFKAYFESHSKFFKNFSFMFQLFFKLFDHI